MDLVGNVKRGANRKSVFKGMNSIIIHNNSINQGKPRRRTVENWNHSFRNKSTVMKKKQEPEVEGTIVMEDTSIKKSSNKKSSSHIIDSANSEKDLIHQDEPKQSKIGK